MSPDVSSEFADFEAAKFELERLQDVQGTYRAIERAMADVEKTFLGNFAAIASKKRVVLLLDTVERLSPIWPEWLIKENLLISSDLKLYTTEWLAQLIEQRKLPNTTLIFSGRLNEGNRFFERISLAATIAGAKVNILRPPKFNSEDIHQYLLGLGEICERLVKENKLPSYIADDINLIAADKDRIEVLRIYTGGLPIRLAIYADLLIEGSTIPDRLKDSPDRAQELILGSEDTLRKAQLEIEESFIELLFSTDSLRAEILKALVRAPLGLDAEQLAIVIFNNTSPDTLRNYDITKELVTLSNLSIIKLRPNGRYALQDEVYRIYAEHCSEKYPEKYVNECIARRLLYKNLRDYAQRNLTEAKAQLKTFQIEDMRELRQQIDEPAQVLKLEFSDIDRTRQKRRSQAQQNFIQWERERIYYALCLDLPRSFNDDYFDPALVRWLVNDPEREALSSIVVHQLLSDKSLHSFIITEDIGWRAQKDRNENIVDALKRIALQDETARWVIRFVSKGEYQRAIDFSNGVDNYIRHGFSDDDTPSYERHSWMHTFAHAQRQVWMEYARILSSQDVDGAIKNLKIIADRLLKLSSGSQDKLVFPDEQESGFIGHPAEHRLNRFIALVYGYIGYGYVTQGKLLQAIENYGHSIAIMRKTEYRVQMATTLNNLARALSERGLGRSRRICMDALNLRVELGEGVQIALSLNTLALIDNDQLRPDLAWVESAMALAYFQRSGDTRGRGLALIQLGEALRRLAQLERDGRVLPNPPMEILYTAERALKEALSIFTQAPVSAEKLRRAEALIEYGCLHRDILTHHPDSPQKVYRDAIAQLNQAIDIAKEICNVKLWLDAMVNRAWTHYRYGWLLWEEQRDQENLQNPPQTQKIEDCFTKAESDLFYIEHEPNLIPECFHITPGNFPPPRCDNSYIYMQLSKMYALRTRIWFERFLILGEVIEHQITQEFIGKKLDLNGQRDERIQKIHENQVANNYLENAAEAFVLAVAYSQIYSPRSAELTYNYDALYGYLKKFNTKELEDFRRFEKRARAKFQLSKIQIEDLGDVDQFLDDCFGMPPKEGMVESEVQ